MAPAPVGASGGSQAAAFHQAGTPMPSAESIGRRTASALVLGLHLALLTAWWDHRTPPRGGATVTTAPQVSWLRLLPAMAAPPDPANPAPNPLPPASRRQPSAAPQAIRPPQPLPTQAPPAPGVAEAAQDRDRTDTAGGTPAASGSAARPARADPRPLDLRLPPPERRGSAPPGPRPTPAEISVESKIARGLANGPLVEEDLGQGRRRFRQGTRCIETRDARMAQIDPFNQSVSGIPKQAEDCSR